MMGKIGCVAVIIASFSGLASAQQIQRVPLSPTGVQPSTNPGIIDGYVFWNASSVHYNGSPCKGMSVRVERSAGVVVGTDSNLTASSIGPYAYCAYSVPNIPEANDLRIRIGMPANTFTPSIGISTSPGAANQGYIQLPGTTCNKLAPLQPSPSDLNAGWWACKDHAHNVNLLIYAPTLTGNLPTHPVATPSSLLKVPSPGPVSGTAVAAAGSQRTLLGNPGSAPSQGMLLPAKPSAAAPQSNGMLVPAVRPSQAMSATGNGGQPIPSSAKPSLPQAYRATKLSMSRYGSLPANANVCVKVIIGSVNGKAAAQIPFIGGNAGGGANPIASGLTTDITFRPGKNYIISGCGFGTSAGRVYLLGQFRAHGGEIMLEPYGGSLRASWGSHWSDQQINAEIDPSLSGEVSQTGVQLIIETSSGVKLRAYGFSFSP